MPSQGPGNPAVDVTDAQNRTNFLMPDSGTVREEYVRANVDVSGAVAVGVRELHGSFDRGTFRRDWSGSSNAVKRQLVRSELSAIDARLEGLTLDRQALWRGYRNGEVTGPTFVRRSLLIHVRAEQLLDRIESVQQLLSIASEPPYVQDYLTPILNLRGRSSTLQNQVGGSVKGAVLGGADPRTVYHLLGENSIVSAAAGDGQFMRVAHLSTNLVANGTDRFAEPRDVSALRRFKELYPWADDNAIRSAQVLSFGNSTFYRGEIVHPQGELQAFIDGSSRDVFREIQTLRPDSVPQQASVTNNTADLALIVNTTGSTGLLHVRVEQSGTRAPLDGRVRIDGQFVGSTGQSGTLWAVQPRGRFTVNVTSGGDTITVSGP